MTTAGTLTAPRIGAHPIEHFARTHHRTLERWLTGNYGRKLNREDVSDVLSETYRAALETEETRDFEAERMSAWAYQVARFRAIAVIRERHGRGPRAGDTPASRRVALSLDELAGGGRGAATAPEPRDEAGGGLALAGVASDSAYAQLAHSLGDAMRAEEGRRVTEALRRLPADQREALQHVHIDGLTIRAAAELLGTSKSTFDRLYRRAIERLQSLCAAEQSADCTRARALIASEATLAPERLGWRDAHVEGCFSCQVAAGRRVHVLLPPLPLITLPSVLAQVLDRAGSLLSRWSALPTEAVAAGVGTTAGGGALAGSSLLGGLGAKTACVLAALTCAGAAAAPVLTHRRAGRPAKPEAATVARHRAAGAAAASPTASTAAEDDARERGGTRAAGAVAKAPAARRHRAKTSRDAGRELSPESFAAPAWSPRASPSASSSWVVPGRVSAPSKPSRSSSSFSQEFRP